MSNDISSWIKMLNGWMALTSRPANCFHTRGCFGRLNTNIQSPISNLFGK